MTHTHDEHEHGCDCGHHHDEELPDVEGHNGFEIDFKASYKVSQDQLWQALTDPEKVKEWFPNLEVTEITEGGEVRYHDGDDVLSFLILDVEAPYLLSYQWKDMIVAFELEETALETELVFKEWIEEVTKEAVVDLTEWAVRLEALRYYLEEGHVPNLDDLYEETYSEVKEMLQ